MKIAPLFLCAIATASALTSNIPGGVYHAENTDSSSNDSRHLVVAKAHGDTDCIGPSLGRGEILYADQSICDEIDGTMVYYGIRSYANYPQFGFTLYRQEIWSDDGRYDRWFRGIGTSVGPEPYLRMQGDGNVVFHGQGSGCLAKPNKRGPDISMRIEGPFPNLMAVRDDDGDIIWNLKEKVLNNNSTTIGTNGCYPEIGPRCVSVFEERERLTWDEYVCEYDSSGETVSWFGLDSHGLLALWRHDDLVWRPGPFHVRGDYLHLQEDGHLTLYRAFPTVSHTFTTDCHGVDSKIVVVDGNVHHLNGDGSTKWVLAGEEPLEPKCFESCSSA